MRSLLSLLACLFALALSPGAAARGPSPDATGPAPDADGGFASHLREAIAVNRARRGVYARATDGRSLLLSTLLITSERASLPVAWWLDARAHRFHEAGVPIVRADFAPMREVGAPSAPPAFTGRITGRDRVRLRKRVRTYRKRVRRAARDEDFAEVARASAELLTHLEQVERDQQAHLAMTRHLAESIGYAAVHARQYRAMTDGETDGLARDLIRSQALALPLAVPVDRMAQAQHARGVGIVVNDVPAIPFEGVPEP